MFRFAVGFAGALLASSAWGQVIFQPPSNGGAPNPYYEKLNEQAAARLRVLNRPRCQVNVQVQQPDGSVRIEQVVPPAPAAQEPELYYRKRDLMPQAAPPSSPSSGAIAPSARRIPTTRPVDEQERIRITPASPRDAAPRLRA